VHVVLVQEGVTHWLPVHTCVELQVLPQVITLPHPSDARPHCRFWVVHV
jgi:hypothetical protein